MKNYFLIFFSILISLLLSYTLQNEISFPFYIMNKKNKLKKNIRSLFQSVSYPVVPNNDDSMCLELCLGSPKYCRLLTIHGQSFYIWVKDIKNPDETFENEKKYDPNKSKTKKINRTLFEIDYEEDRKITGYRVIDNIYLKGGKLLMRGNFLSVIESQNFTGDEGIIGLGYRGSKIEEKNSFVKQLYNNGYIFHRVFTQSFTDSAQGMITFGEIPTNIVDDYKKYGRCAALNKIVNGKNVKNRKWECQIDGIYFGNKYKESEVKKLKDTRASFFSFRKKALVPMEIFTYFEQTYFENYIKEGTCQKFNDNQYDYFGCKKNIENADKINLIYGDWVMSIPSEKLFKFKKSTELYEFMFYHKKDFESFSLGRPVVRNFHMVYDYQNQEIGFYNKDNVFYINEKSEPAKPKVYEKLPDAGEGVDDNDDLDDLPIDDKKEDQKISNEDLVKKIKEKSGMNTNKKDGSSGFMFTIQKVFYGFIITVLIIVGGFVIYIYIRHKTRPEYFKSEYFLQKVNELSTRV